MPRKRTAIKTSNARSQQIFGRLPRNEAIGIGIFIVIVIALFYFKSLFIAATVNGTSVPRFAVINQLEKTAGKQTLDSLINKELILQEAKREKISVSNQELDQRIKQIEASIKQQGGNLEQVLKAQGLTQQDLQDQVKLQLIVEKLFANKIKVSDKEVDQFIAENQASLPETTQATETAQLRDSVKQQIFQNKLAEKVQELITNLKKSAKIDYLINY